MHASNSFVYQCPECGNSPLESIPLDHEKDQPIYKSHVCPLCKVEYKSFLDIPYLGRFIEKDLLSVMEISSLLVQFTLDDQFRPKGINGGLPKLRDGYNKIKKLVACSKDEKGTGVDLKAYGYDQVPNWFSSRFNEYEQLCDLLEGLDFQGRQVLDIGAGTGFDASRFSDMGGQVTALEYNPIQAVIGAYNFPEIKWVGGSVACLPFPDESFDIVIANAALHHVVGLESALDEMLRVLRVGGTLLTMADSFAPENFSEEDEVTVFNHHRAVLKGVNEQLPRIGRYLRTFQERGEALTTTVFTSIVHGYHKRERPMRQWSMDEAYNTLQHYRGGLGIRSKKLEVTHHKQKSMLGELIEVESYITCLRDRRSALTCLSDVVPKHLLDLRIESRSNQKLFLVLGWCKPENGIDYREAVEEAHLFVSPFYIKYVLPTWRIMLPHDVNTKQRNLSIFLNGDMLDEIEISGREWVGLSVELLERMAVVAKSSNLLTLAIDGECSELEESMFWVSSSPNPKPNLSEKAIEKNVINKALNTRRNLFSRIYSKLTG